MKTKYFVLLLAMVFVSCKRETVTVTPSPKPETKATVNSSSTANLLQNCPEKTVPLVDSTNFNHHQKFRILSTAEQKTLGLQKIYLSENKNEIKAVSLDYSLALSSKFKTLVITYYFGDHEMFTFLINYDSNYKILGFLNIAYDEIAESASSTQSELTQDRIIVMDRDYLSDPTVITKTSYAIKPNGSILKE